MQIKIDNQTSAPLPKKTEVTLRSVLGFLPREHSRGLDRFKFVSHITDPRFKSRAPSQLPALYHPRQGTQPAWAEISVETLIPSSRAFHQRILPRLTYKSNLAAIVISLVGQHYHITMRHSIKKGQLEGTIRTYTEKHLKSWHERNNKLRTRLFKPLQPYLEKWARTLRQRASKKRGISWRDLSTKSIML